MMRTTDDDRMSAWPSAAGAFTTDDPARAGRTDTIVSQFDELMQTEVGRHASEFLEVDITMAQAKVMHLALLRPGIRMSAIAAELHVGLSSVSGLVERLVEHGYVERHEDPDDRRQHLVTVSRHGTEIMDRFRDMNAMRLRQLLDGLDARELEAVSAAFAALIRSARDLDADAEPRPTPQTTRTPR